jgi:arylamine N-acetyltransferase
LDHAISTVFANTVTKHTLWCDYIYLDTDERRRFAQVSHEYLIEQIQDQSWTAATGANNQALNFNHPVKELIWVAAVGASGAVTSTSLVEPAAGGTTYQLKLNGHDRFASRHSNYFSRVQVHQHHSGCGGLTSVTADTGSIGHMNDSICVYSFALKPEEHQPSGTCNFSRIDNAQLHSSATIVSNTVIFAVNYNVLRIMSGMGGLAYSN